MFVHYRTPGLILKKVDRGEANQLFTVYTRKYGKVEILGKAIRKIKSKLRAGADLFYFSDIEFIQGKTYKTLTDTILLEKFPNIRKDFRKLNVASKIAESLDSLTRTEEKDERVWSLFLESFKLLDNAQEANINTQLIYYYFLWRLLNILGYRPQLYSCPVCQKKLTPGLLFFNFQEGGIICSNCFKKIKKGEKVFPETVKILRVIIEKDWKTTSSLKFEQKELKVLKEISGLYLSSINNAAISDY